MKLGRLACYGVLREGAGSTPSANYVLLRELTRRGVEVDLFATPEQAPPPAGASQGGFGYRRLTPPRLDRFIASLPATASWGLHRLLLPLLNASWRRSYEPVAESLHETAPYDLLLALGMIAPFQLSGVPTVSWPQGPLFTELEAIRRLRKQIVAARGWPFYLAVVAAYRYSEPIRRRSLSSSEQIVVGSEWARQAVIGEGFQADRVHALPYPIDLDLFRPAEGRSEPDSSAPTIVSLGRLDPRKRLDLLLAAFELVLRELPGATLRIVGGPGYTPKQLEMIDRFPATDRIRYQAELPREQVPQLLRESTVLAQTSENETFGSSVAEALACGIPVVVGPSNGTAQYIDRASQRFDDYTAEAVAAAILRVLESRRQDPEAVRRSTRAVAEHWFRPAAVVDRLLEIMAATPPDRAS